VYLQPYLRQWAQHTGVMNLTLQGRSHGVIDHITIQLAIYYFLLVSHWSRASIFNRFRDICIRIYLDHDLDLSRSRDVIGHVTIWFPRCHFL